MALSQNAEAGKGEWVVSDIILALLLGGVGNGVANCVGSGAGAAK